MELNEQIPEITFSITPNQTGTIGDYQGKKVVLYFYPKDATQGCTLEAQDFRDAYPQFLALNTIILGVSRDSLTSHERFRANQNLPFELISDKDEALCQLFDVIKMKSMYGKQVRGIERSTFLIDEHGVLKHIWRKVSVKGHVAQVLDFLRQSVC